MKPAPVPLTTVHGDFDRALEATLLAAGLLCVYCETMLDLGQVSKTCRGALAKRVADFRLAYSGDKS